MRGDHTFHVALPVEETWRRLTDLSQVAACVPGTRVGEVRDGTLHATLGRHEVTASFLERDEVDHRLVLAARTRNGTATATLTARLHGAADGTRVDLHLYLTGTAGPAPETVDALLTDLTSHLTSPPEPQARRGPVHDAPAPGGAPPGPDPGEAWPGTVRRAAVPAGVAVVAGVAGFLLGRRRG